MHKIEKKCLLNFFELINENFEYVVMRNASELPFENFSNDIDILINKSDYVEFHNTMNEVFCNNGFDRVERTSFHGIECFTYYNIQSETPYSLKIDLFFNFEGGGVSYYKFEEVIRYKIKNPNGIYVFNLEIEGYLTALKTIAAGGKLGANYLNNFLKLNIDFNHELIKKCPSRALIGYMEDIIATKNNPIIISRGKILREAFIDNFKNQPLLSIKRLSTHYWKEISRAFKKQYMVVFVGPDGSGKTTLIEKLKQDSKLILRSNSSRFKVFHHRPHIFPNISQIFKKNLNDKEVYDLTFNPHSEKQSNSFISFFKIMYYITDYILGYVKNQMPLQRQDKFIVYDRYYYDFIVDQKRSALFLPKNVTIWLYRFFIPKPNKVFFIKVNAQIAHQRKEELPVETIININNQYDELSKSLKNFTIIPNEDLNTSYNYLLKEFILVISKKISA